MSKSFAKWQACACRRLSRGAKNAAGLWLTNAAYIFHAPHGKPPAASVTNALKMIDATPLRCLDFSGLVLLVLVGFFLVMSCLLPQVPPSPQNIHHHTEVAYIQDVLVSRKIHTVCRELSSLVLSAGPYWYCVSAVFLYSETLCHCQDSNTRDRICALNSRKTVSWSYNPRP